MSTDGWKRVYYMYDAVLAPTSAALEHELRHCLGLRYLSRIYHGLRIKRDENGYVIGVVDRAGHVHPFNSETRALCVNYEDPAGLACVGCPVYEYRGGVRCDRRSPGESESPIEYYRNSGSVKRYLEILRELVRLKYEPIAEKLKIEEAKVARERVMLERLKIEFAEMPLDRPWHNLARRKK